MPKRKHKKYSRPKKLYDISLMKEEGGLIKKYGLKSRREVWKANYIIAKIRDIAKSLITAKDKEQKEFVERQQRKGFTVNNIAEVLSLSKEDLLKRRLQSIIVQKGFAKTYKLARQLIVHKHITVKGKIMDSPSHLTTLEEEMNIGINIKIPEKKVISDEEKNILEKIKHEKVEVEA